MLPFKSDFSETLIKHRRLPTSSLKSKLIVASTLSKIKTNLKIDQNMFEMTDKELQRYFKKNIAMHLNSVRSKSKMDSVQDLEEYRLKYEQA